MHATAGTAATTPKHRISPGPLAFRNECGRRGCGHIFEYEGPNPLGNMRRLAEILKISGQPFGGASRGLKLQCQRESARPGVWAGCQVLSARGEDPTPVSIFLTHTEAGMYLGLTQLIYLLTPIAMLLPEPRVIPTPPVELDGATAPTAVDLVRRHAEPPFAVFQCEAALGFGADGFLAVDVEEAVRDTDGDADEVQLVPPTLGAGSM
ncbi:hypothetical protein DFH08DRAFT_1011935 [Mycena albidolilacea]|uniref:Uncharacterized protein n=1 Tax=Mycena albidolilacea TaxID=1033008 RepID=A0AAD7EMY4_9AGAR|nr:hypothetical protein DFH08DRAFT_1011935 [Mycena albidolilacea]